MLRTMLLAAHVVAGTAGVVLGPAVTWPLVRRSRSRPRLEGAYLLAVTAVCASALGLVLISLGAFWWLAPIAAVTAGAAYAAYRLRGRTAITARTWRARLLGGTYVALVTALLVVSWGGWMSWVLPSIVGAALVEYAATVQRRLPEADARREELDHAV